MYQIPPIYPNVPNKFYRFPVFYDFKWLENHVIGTIAVNDARVFLWEEKKIIANKCITKKTIRALCFPQSYVNYIVGLDSKGVGSFGL